MVERAAAETFSVGDRCEANYQGLGVWYSGRIADISPPRGRPPPTRREVTGQARCSTSTTTMETSRLRVAALGARPSHGW